MRRSLGFAARLCAGAAALWSVVAPPLAHTHGTREEICAAGLVASSEGTRGPVWLPTRLLPPEPCAACALGPGSPAEPSPAVMLAPPRTGPLQPPPAPLGRAVWTPQLASARSPPRG